MTERPEVSEVLDRLNFALVTLDRLDAPIAAGYVAAAIQALCERYRVNSIVVPTDHIPRLSSERNSP